MSNKRNNIKLEVITIFLMSMFAFSVSFIGSLFVSVYSCWMVARCLSV